MVRSARPALLLVAIVVAACSSDDGRTAPTIPERADVQAERCLVRVHGRSETGGAPVDRGDHAEVLPYGNDTAGDGFQWRYGTDDEVASATANIEGWIDAVGCEQVILNGFSNGAAAVGALHCRGETFDGRVVGVVIDDPVPDDAVSGCDADPSVAVTLYWTGGLTEAAAGVSCDEIGFTCAGEELLGIDAYAEALGVTVTPSPHDQHVWYRQAPENSVWPEEGGR
ncbi:MAG: hypothetical protein GXY13_13100 [Acidimicrobiales bacterium]|nr:hypothetical protein [Acidimicrobiales bacterium]